MHQKPSEQLERERNPPTHSAQAQRHANELSDLRNVVNALDRNLDVSNIQRHSAHEYGY